VIHPVHGQARGSIPADAGVGLRFQHHRAVLEEKPGVAWFEMHSENYFGGGTPLRYLDAVRRDYPVSLHGVGLSLGSAEGLDERHLGRIRALMERIEPGLISEHLAWNAVDGAHFADLLPLPLTEEALTIVCRNIEVTQDFLGSQILIENPSSYLRYRHSTIPEWEFMAEIAERTGCGILCDVNNIFVSSCNHGFDACHYLRGLPAGRIGEIHLAGHRVRKLDDGRSIRIDDHGSRVCDEVWSLYALAAELFGRVPTLIEWDTDVPALATLLQEAAKARTIMTERALDACAA
jgi:uncharacterized protein (UPF0276 family)